MTCLLLHRALSALHLHITGPGYGARKKEKFLDRSVNILPDARHSGIQKFPPYPGPVIDPARGTDPPSKGKARKNNPNLLHQGQRDSPPSGLPLFYYVNLLREQPFNA